MIIHHNGIKHRISRARWAWYTNSEYHANIPDGTKVFIFRYQTADTIFIAIGDKIKNTAMYQDDYPYLVRIEKATFHYSSQFWYFAKLDTIIPFDKLSRGDKLFITTLRIAGKLK